MLGDGSGSEYDITRLWRDARMDQALLDAERRIRPAGGSGCEGGAEPSVGVVWPDDWDAEDYAAWSDHVNERREYDTAGRVAWEREVDEIYAAEEVERMAREADERVNDH